MAVRYFQYISPIGQPFKIVSYVIKTFYDICLGDGIKSISFKERKLTAGKKLYRLHTLFGIFSPTHRKEHLSMLLCKYDYSFSAFAHIGFFYYDSVYLRDHSALPLCTKSSAGFEPSLWFIRPVPFSPSVPSVRNLCLCCLHYLCRSGLCI